MNKGEVVKIVKNLEELYFGIVESYRTDLETSFGEGYSVGKLTGYEIYPLPIQQFFPVNHENCGMSLGMIFPLAKLAIFNRKTETDLVRTAEKILRQRGYKTSIEKRKEDYELPEFATFSKQTTNSPRARLIFH